MYWVFYTSTATEEHKMKESRNHMVVSKHLGGQVYKTKLILFHESPSPSDIYWFKYSGK